MTNIIKAISYIASNFSNDLFKEEYSKKLRFTDALESFITDSFLELYNDTIEEKNRKKSEVFSWLGNNMNPPHIELKNRESVLIKKLTSSKISLINYPSSDIKSKEKDLNSNKKLIYCIGEELNGNLKKIWFFYGELIAADFDIYERFLSNINYRNEFEKIDPLGITKLKDNYWIIKNPDEIFELNSYKNDFLEVVTIIPNYIYDLFSLDDLKKLNHSKFNIKDKKVKDPNNVVKMIDCKLITFSV